MKKRHYVSLAQTGKYGAVNEAYPTTIGYYTVNNVFDDFILQEDTTTESKVDNLGELVSR